MRQVIMTVGLQASGKSTWARQWVTEATNRKRINRDELRAMLDAGQWSPTHERFVLVARNNLLRQALESGCDVVLDDTNLRSANFRDVCTFVESLGVEATVSERFFPVTLEEAIARDAKRLNSVGELAIRQTADRYYARLTGHAGPMRSETLLKGKSGIGIDFVPGRPSAVICDLDGTLALMGDRSPYDASRCDELDAPNEPVIRCIEAMERDGCKVIFMSAREEKDRVPTERFIRKCGLTPSFLHMRATGDQRKDSVVKRELFDANVRGKFNVRFVLDDRNQVVREWRAMGLPCFQVAEGAF
jgi:predicted kinase